MDTTIYLIHNRVCLAFIVHLQTHQTPDYNFQEGNINYRMGDWAKYNMHLMSLIFLSGYIIFWNRKILPIKEGNGINF